MKTTTLLLCSAALTASAFGAGAQTNSNPVILSSGPSFGVKTNQFGFIISGATNAPVIIEASTNLGIGIWSPIATNTLNNGSVYFSDLDWTNYLDRFYRVRSETGVYSTNIVGYANVTVAAGYNLLANPLSAGVRNGADEIMTPIDGEQILTWNGAGYDYIMYSSIFGSWINGSENPWLDIPSLPPGRGFFFFNPSTATNITFVGTVVPGPSSTNCINPAGGYSLLGSPLPANVADISSPPVSLPLLPGMEILKWNGFRGFDWSSWGGPVFGGWIGPDLLPATAPSYEIGQGFFMFSPTPNWQWCQSLP